ALRDGDRGHPYQHPAAPGADERRRLRARRREHPLPGGEDGGAQVDPGRRLAKDDPMAWQRLAIVVEGRHAEALGEALEDAGAVSTEITDADAGIDREQALFGEPGADAGLWPRCR